MHFTTFKISIKLSEQSGTYSKGSPRLTSLDVENDFVLFKYKMNFNRN